MADEFAEIRDMRERFMRAVYNRKNPGQSDAAPHDVIMRDLGLEPDLSTPQGRSDTEQYDAIVRYWEQRRFVEHFTEAMVRITPDHQTFRVDEQMSLSTADLLATIVASYASFLGGLGLLWESMIAALGVGSLPSGRRSLSRRAVCICSQVPSMRQALK